jgi:hypothetical protein
MFTTYYIKLPDHEAHRRAVEVFMDKDLFQGRLVFPDHVMGVSLEHLRALEEAQVPFEMTSGGKWNGQTAATVQS